jgi:hypothetical protein
LHNLWFLNPQSTVACCWASPCHPTFPPAITNQQPPLQTRRVSQEARITTGNTHPVGRGCARQHAGARYLDLISFLGLLNFLRLLPCCASWSGERFPRFRDTCQSGSEGLMYRPAIRVPRRNRTPDGKVAGSPRTEPFPPPSGRQNRKKAWTTIDRNRTVKSF